MPSRQSKPVRITIDLDGQRYATLAKWVNSAAVAIDPDRPPRLSQAKVIRALIDLLGDEAVTGAVLKLLRREN